MPDLVCIEQHPAYRHTRDENAWQQAAELVADRHFSNVSPEFNEWWSDVCGEYHCETALIVSNLVVGADYDKAEARRLAVRIQDDFACFVANATDFSTWKLVRDLYEEVRKEAQC
jgi:hypothetical protein